MTGMRFVPGVNLTKPDTRVNGVSGLIGNHVSRLS